MPRTWRLRLAGLGVVMILGGVLPWFASVDLISADETEGAKSLFSLVPGLLVLALGAIGRAPKASGFATVILGVVSALAIWSGLGATFITGPPFGPGMALAIIGSGLAIIGGMLLLIEHERRAR